MKNIITVIVKFFDRPLKILMLIAAILFTSGNAFADRVKKIERKISVKPDQGIILANFSNADLIIKSHDKSEISYSLTVTIKADDADDENEFIDSIYFKERNSAKEVILQMIDHAPNNEQTDITIFGLQFGDVFNKSVKGEIYLPLSAWVNIGMRSCKANIDAITAELKTAGDHNALTLKNCKNIKSISNKNGTAKLSECAGNTLEIEGRNGTYSCYGINGMLTINAPYSTIEVKDLIGKLNVQSRSGIIKCNNISEEVMCSADYSTIKMERIKRNMTVSARSSTLNFTEVNSVNVDADYSTINIRKSIVQDSARGVEIVSRSATIRLDEIKAKVDIEAPYSKIGFREVNGNIGCIGRSSTITGVRTEGNLDISSDYGVLEFREIKAKVIRAETTNGNIRFGLLEQPEKLIMHAPHGTISITVPHGFDGKIHLNALSGIDSNLDCLSGQPDTRKFDGKSRTGKISDISIRAANILFNEK